MSDFLVHFTHTKDELKQIFDDACVKASGPFGAAKGIGSPALPSQKSVCLSEIPLDYLDRLVDRHGSYGIGFRKAWAIEKNATRVWYLDKDSAVADKVVDWAQAGGPGAWEDDPIYSLTPFIDYVGTFNGVRANSSGSGSGELMVTSLSCSRATCRSSSFPSQISRL